MRATLVVPTLNEAESIGHVLRSFRTAAEEANRGIWASDPIDWEILVVDGASTDGTADRARAEGARVLVERRKGYGRAYRTGFAAARGDYIATSDGDATYPVETIPGLLRRLVDERYDFLSGNRLAYLQRRSMTTEHRIGNRMLNLFLHVAYHHYLASVEGGRLEDSQSGFWIFRRAILEPIDPHEDGMAFSEELKIEVLLKGFRFVEVPIRYGERWGRPKLSSWRDGFGNLLFLYRKRIAVAHAERDRQHAHGAEAGQTRPG
ncbi:MAG: glycosyltransferase [Thermoplasmata archaeon]